MISKDETPFDNIESSHEYVSLLAEAIRVALAEFFIFGVLYWRFGKAHTPGAVISLYLMLYSTARFIVEFFRYHEQGNLWGSPLDASQWISIVLFAVGASYYAVSRRRLTAQAA